MDVMWWYKNGPSTEIWAFSVDDAVESSIDIWVQFFASFLSKYKEFGAFNTKSIDNVWSSYLFLFIAWGGSDFPIWDLYSQQINTFVLLSSFVDLK